MSPVFFQKGNQPKAEPQTVITIQEADLHAIQQAVAAAEAERTKLVSEVSELRASYPAAIKNGSLDVVMASVSERDARVKQLDDFLSENKMILKDALFLKLRGDLAQAQQSLRDAEDREAVILRDVDQLVEQIAKKTRELFSLAKEIQDGIPHSVAVLGELESGGYMARAQAFARIRWDLKLSYYRYRVARGTWPTDREHPVW